MVDIRILRTLAVASAICFGVAILVPARPVLASTPQPERSRLVSGAVVVQSTPPQEKPKDMPPLQTPTPAPAPNPITQIINQIIQFPFESLSDALQNAAKSILNGTVTPLETFFSASVARWLTSNPGIITPGGGIANGEDVMGPAWRLMVKVAVLLWPLTLAILAAIAAKDAVAAASWGVGDLKETLGGWLIAVIGSATSLYWMDLANRFTNATTLTILNMSFTGEAGFQPNALTAIVFGTAALLLGWVAMPAALVIVVFVILMGLAVLSSLIFQFLARFVILYLLVALAPVVIILGVLPPLGWFRAMWLRGFVMVEAIGPINALLLKLVMVLAVRGTSNDPITAFVNFIGAIGVLSILLTVDGVIIKGVFGAADEVMQKAVGTVQALGTLALAGVTAMAGGSIEAGALAAGGAAATGGIGGGGAGGAGGATAPISSATAAGAKQGAGVGGPASAARRAFDPGAALRGAGDVLYRQPGMLGGLGAAMRSVGGTLERSDRERQAESRWQAGQAERQTSREEQQTRWEASQAQGQARRDEQSARWSNQSKPGSTKSTGPNGGDAPTAPPTSPITGGPNQGGPTTSPGGATPNSTSAPAPATLNTGDGNRIPNAPIVPNNLGDMGPIAAVTAPPTTSTPGAAALPPAQMPSVSPMGAPLASSAPRGNALVPEAAGAVNMLPPTLSERAGAFASLYPDSRDQVVAARSAVDAFNQLNSRGQGFSDVGWQGNAWDRSMPPVIASARQGLPLETMAQDAGFSGNVAGFLTQRMQENREPTLQLPSQPAAWHSQLAPHDWETGTAISNALGNQVTQGAAARIYHEVRSPETGGGWSAGTQFVQTVQEFFHQGFAAPSGGGLGQQPPTDPIAALGARLAEMETRGVVSARSMTLWRANTKSKS